MKWVSEPSIWFQSGFCDVAIKITLLCLSDGSQESWGSWGLNPQDLGLGDVFWDPAAVPRDTMVSLTLGEIDYLMSKNV